jgi:hypothetical protein
MGLDGRRLAIAILSQAWDDVQVNPYGRGENERFGQDQERVLEVVGEAQWFFLDDDDEDAPHSFPWCCSMINVEPSYLRAGVEAFLTKSKFLLIKPERHRLAELAGRRRLRQHFTKPKDRRKTCATDGCFRLTRETLCRLCTMGPDHQVKWYVVECVKCHESTEVMAEYRRRPYCENCQGLCARPECFEPRRPGSRTTTCREHHRLERKTGRRGDKGGKPYTMPKPSPSISY